MDYEAVFLSFKLGFLVTLSVLIVCVPISYLLARSASIYGLIFESMMQLPLVLPPTVLGFYFLLSLNIFHLAFSFFGLWIALACCSLPFAMQPLLTSFRLLDSELIEASYALGESKVRTFFRISLPLSWAGILSAAVLCFAHCLGEFGVVMMIGGNIPGVTRTLSLALYDQVEAMDFAAANRTALFLLSLSLVSLIVLALLRRKVLVRA